MKMTTDEERVLRGVEQWSVMFGLLQWSWTLDL